LNISDRMTLANLASEMGAKNAVFPADDVLRDFYGNEVTGVWADDDADYVEEIRIDMGEVVPLVAAPHHVDNVKTVLEVEGTAVQQGLIGTCTNGRIEDLRAAAEILKGKTVAPGFQLLVIPASQKIYLEAMEEGLIKVFLEAGANVLSSSCGPCLGTGQGIPADGFTVISTANRNFKGRMGNMEAQIYLASPATVAASALEGRIRAVKSYPEEKDIVHRSTGGSLTGIPEGENRRMNAVWNYADADNLNTDQMFAGNLTYNILSTDPGAILPHLFEGFDPSFAQNVREGDVIVAGENFGCGSSREHPAVGLAYAGVRAVIVKSVNRIFFRSCINQGLPLILQREVVSAYHPGDRVSVDLISGCINLNDKGYAFVPLPDKLMRIIVNRGLVNWIRES
jgi:3-isopropylmalate/(R)-2-methylmalate dehydratase large subunit